MAYAPGTKKVTVPLSRDQWFFMRQLAADRRSSVAQELSTIVVPEIERMRRRQRRQDPDEAGVDDAEPTSVD